MSPALPAIVPIAVETVAGAADGPAGALEAVVDDAGATAAADMVATAVAEDVTSNYSATKAATRVAAFVLISGSEAVSWGTNLVTRRR